MTPVPASSCNVTGESGMENIRSIRRRKTARSNRSRQLISTVLLSLLCIAFTPYSIAQGVAEVVIAERDVAKRGVAERGVAWQDLSEQQQKVLSDAEYLWDTMSLARQSALVKLSLIHI